MADLRTCEEHDGAIVVWTPSYGVAKCPSCKQDEKVEELEGKLETANSDYENLKDKFDRLTSERE